MEEAAALLENLFIYLLAAVLAVPGAKYLGLGSVLGYLLAGIVIGPWGLALIREAEHIVHFAQFGVVMLLFLIGLELRPAQLIRMRRTIFGYGTLQVIVTTLVIFIIAILLNRAWYEALVVAMALSLSSTAIAVQLLDEKNLRATTAGESAFSILLFQDMAVIPMLSLVPLLGLGNPMESNEGWIGFAKAAVAVVLIVLSGRYLLRHAYRYIASTQLPEMFTAFSLLVVISIALLMHSVGLSMALGTFLCGVLLADSEFRHEIKSNIQPFKGLLLGLFFISVGMAVDFGLVLQRPGEILGLLLVLLAVKAGVLYFIARVAEVPIVERPWFSILLSQSGEFAFVLLGVAATHHTITEKLAAMLTLVVALSMLSTPILLVLVERYSRIRPEANGVRTKNKDPGSDRSLNLQASETPDEHSRVVIAGFGRVGQIVARLMSAGMVNIAVIDHDPVHIELVRKFGCKVYYGDALRIDLLMAAGIERADILVIAIDDRDRVMELVEVAKRSFPHLKIVARAWDMPHQWQLMEKGADIVQRETFESAVLMGEDVLTLLGLDIDEVERLSEAFRDHDVRLLDEMYAAKSAEVRIRISRRGRDEFERLIEGDIRQRELEKRLSDEEDTYG